MTSSRGWARALAVCWCWVGTAGHAQPSGAGEQANTAPREAGRDAMHPLFSDLTPPAWLAGRGRLLVLGPSTHDTSAEAAWTEMLRVAFAGSLPGGVVEVASARDASSLDLAARLLTAGHDSGVSVALRRDQQRVVLTARYVDMRTQPPVEHVSQAMAPLDAFLVRVVGGVPSVRASSVRARSLRFDAAGLLGAFAADLDGDQRDELIVARGPHVSVYALEAAGGAQLRLVRRARTRWPMTRRTVPMVRRVVAWFSFDERRVVLTRTDREGAFSLALVDGELRFEPVTSPCAGGRTFPDGCARWVPGRDYFDGELLPAGAPNSRSAGVEGDEETEPSEDVPSPAPRYYTRSVHDVRQPSGDTLRMAVLVTPAGTLVANAAGQRGSTGRQGASLAAADIDADGVLDVLTSDYVREGQEDRLRWHRVSADGRVALLWEGPRFSGSVLHSVAGDFLGTGRSVFVAFEVGARGGSRMWAVD